MHMQVRYAGSSCIPEKTNPCCDDHHRSLLQPFRILCICGISCISESLEHTRAADRKNTDGSAQQKATNSAKQTKPTPSRLPPSGSHALRYIGVRILQFNR